MEKITYKCSFCNREHVKLWRANYLRYLICASCAEERQCEIKYVERIWEKIGSRYKSVGNNGMKILPRWTVDEKGKVPSYDGPRPFKRDQVKVDNLYVDIYDDGVRYRLNMFPAILKENEEEFYDSYKIPKDKYELWEKLPTR